MAEGGYDTASYIYDLVWYKGTQNYNPGLVNKYGTPKYWIRYFSPSPNGTVNGSSTVANNEVRAAWDSGARYLGAISSPGNLSTGSAQGLAAAQTFINSLIYVYTHVSPLGLPSNNELYCWLDQEAGTSLSSSYWTAWCSYINQYAYAGAYPFFACLYCDPPDPHPNCSIIAADGGCWAVWSSVYEKCGGSLKSLPAWDAASCGAPAPATKLWQFAEAGYCGLSYNVDMDEGTVSLYSFLIYWRP